MNYSSGSVLLQILELVCFINNPKINKIPLTCMSSIAMNNYAEAFVALLVILEILNSSCFSINHGIYSLQVTWIG